jgi:hypothetical protein
MIEASTSEFENPFGKNGSVKPFYMKPGNISNINNSN